MCFSQTTLSFFRHPLVFYVFLHMRGKKTDFFLSFLWVHLYNSFSWHSGRRLRWRWYWWNKSYILFSKPTSFSVKGLWEWYHGIMWLVSFLFFLPFPFILIIHCQTLLLRHFGIIQKKNWLELQRQNALLPANGPLTGAILWLPRQHLGYR